MVAMVDFGVFPGATMVQYQVEGRMVKRDATVENGTF